jgi:hypothetical protein
MQPAAVYRISPQPIVVTGVYAGMGLPVWSVDFQRNAFQRASRDDIKLPHFEMVSDAEADRLQRLTPAERLDEAFAIWMFDRF